MLSALKMYTSTHPRGRSGMNVKKKFRIGSPASLAELSKSPQQPMMTMTQQNTTTRDLNNIALVKICTFSCTIINFQLDVFSCAILNFQLGAFSWAIITLIVCIFMCGFQFSFVCLFMGNFKLSKIAILKCNFSSFCLIRINLSKSISNVIK